MSNSMGYPSCCFWRREAGAWATKRRADMIFLTKTAEKKFNESGFVNSIVMEGFIILAVVGAILAIVIPSYVNYRARKQKTIDRANDQKNFYNLVSLAMGSLDGDVICPLTGKPYPITTQGSTRIISWPDPDSRYTTSPQFIITEKGAFFRQNLPPYRIRPGRRAFPADTIDLINETDKVVLLNKSNNIICEFPKTGGRVVVKKPGGSQLETLDHIVAALPINKKERTQVFSLLYIEAGQVKITGVFKTRGRIHPSIAMVCQALFPPGVPLAKTQLAPYPK